MHPHSPRRRGGTALLAACVIAGLTASLAGYSASNSANAPTAERAFTSSTAHGVDSKLLRPLPVAYVTYIPPEPKPPVPPLVDRGRVPEVPERRVPLPAPAPVPVPVPPDAARGQAIAVKEQEIINPYIEGLTNYDDIRHVIDLACKIKDAADIAQANSLGDATYGAVTSFGGRLMLPHRIIGLAQKMAKEQSSGDQIADLAIFGICEMASR